ncbi:hypothetical protein [Streptomyces sp. NPDC127190]|uniref:hypothetical protein n=1 Tax=unclassified Streptomyces TaxID=2593676 RepID=UPI003624AD3A
MPPPSHPSPYGPQQPQQPYPYGSQPPQGPAGPYGSPYPQAQPYPPAQAYPQAQPYPQQQPYPGQPYPPQQQYPGWGVPPMGPPPKKRRVGLVLGIVGGVVTAGVVGLILLGTAAEGGFPEAKNKLVLPHTLLDGKYTLAQDLSGTEGKKVEEEADGAWDAKDIHAVTGRYSPGGDDTKGMLLVSSMYGRFKNQDDVRSRMLKGATQADGVTLDQPPKDVTPPGAATTISCEVLTQKGALATLTYPVCSWADGNTAAVVAEVDMATTHAADVDLAAAARHTVTVRSEMLRPLG